MNNSINQFIKNKKLFLLGIISALFLMAIDLYSKYYVFSVLEQIKDDASIYSPILEVTNFFNLVMVWNRGVSFGMLNSITYAKILILTLNLIIVSVLLIWLFRNKIQYIAIAIAFIIGGALGNFVDRVMNDAVADFLDFHAFGYHWPAFNVADSCVFIGVAMLLFENFFVKKDEK